MLVDGDRDVGMITYITMGSSICTISKVVNELWTSADLLSFDKNLGGGQTCIKKFFIVSFSHLLTFVSSMAFRTGSIVIIFAFFKVYGLIHLVILCIVNFTVVAKLTRTNMTP